MPTESPGIRQGGALADQQAVHLDHQDHGDDTEQRTDQDCADAVPDRIAGQDRQAHAGEREDQTDQAPVSSSRTTGSSGLRERRMNCHHELAPFNGRDSTIAVRKL